MCRIGVIVPGGNRAVHDFIDRHIHEAQRDKIAEQPARGDRRPDPPSPAEDDGIFGAHGTSSSLPVVLRLSMSAWAFAASASRYSPPTRTLSFPSAIQSNSCAECARSS